MRPGNLYLIGVQSAKAAFMSRHPATDKVPAACGVDEFDELVVRYSRLMASAIRRVCGRHHPDLIPDAEQEVRLALWKHLKGGKRIHHPVSYLYRVALTSALSVVRRQSSKEELLDPDQLDVRTASSGLVFGLSGAERRRLLEQVLGRLPRDQARALKGYLAGMNYKEVATLWGWSESVARHRIYRGMQALGTLGRQESTDE